MKTLTGPEGRVALYALASVTGEVPVVVAVGSGAAVEEEGGE